MSAEHIDGLEDRLRRAAGLAPVDYERCIRDSRSFTARMGGCGARVQLDHIDGRPVGGISIMLHHLSADTAEAVLQFLSGRNEPNGASYDR